MRVKKKYEYMYTHTNNRYFFPKLSL